jgi:hypothetical protein
MMRTANAADSKTVVSREDLLTKLKEIASVSPQRRLARQDFLSKSGLKLSDIFRHFPRWSDALSAAGLDYEPYHQRIDNEKLLEDWARVARQKGSIPTRYQYKLEGKYSPGVFDRLCRWSDIPERFRTFAESKQDWNDVLELLPPVNAVSSNAQRPSSVPFSRSAHETHHRKIEKRPTYGNPIDFRGLRHEPVNEQGVVFLFGMVARELGYIVEAIQPGFPDCEAKRRVGPNTWQSVRIEFEFDSRNFAEHNHDSQDCDILVCWRHNWPDCPLEVVELSTVIKSLGHSED